MRRGNVIGGGALILVGLLFLLETLDIVNINVWGVIWPVALIIAGIWILGSLTYQKGDMETEALSIPAEGAERARVTVRHGAGRLEIGPGAASDELLSGTVSRGSKLEEKWWREGWISLWELQGGFILSFPLSNRSIGF